MAVSVVCPGCDADYSVPDTLLGKAIRCKKCGETIDVKARPKAKARVSRDDEEDVRPRKAVPRRRGDDEDDYDDAPKKKGVSPVLIGGLAALLLGAGAAGAYFMFSGDKQQDVAKVEPTPAPARKTVAVDDAKTDDSTTDEPKAEPAKSDAAKPEEKKPEEAKAVVKKVEPKKPEAKKAEEKIPAAKPPSTDPAVAAKDPGKAFTDLPLPGVAAEKGGNLSGISYERYLSGTMDPITMANVKKAAVDIFCESVGGAGTGSGWFGIEPGIVFTNAHVLHMKAPNTPFPKKIKFTLNSGLPNQRDIPHANIKILAVDREIDLAVLQVINEKDLPAPLRVRLSSDTFEGLRLTTVGFPFGATPSKISGGASHDPELSLRPTVVTSYRRNDYGQLRRVQLEGGANPGNSGGAVVDAEGSVCTVIVEGVHSGGGAATGIALTMGVPTEYCFGILAGRIAETHVSLAYKDGENVRIPIKVNCLDPMNRLKSVGVAGWIGNPSAKFRAPGTVKPKTDPGDRNYTEVALKYDSKTKIATGELILPKKPDGTVYWIQPYYSSPIVERYWQPGIVYNKKGEAAERVDANLVYRPAFGKTRAVTMSQTFAQLEAGEGEGAGKNEMRQRKYGLTVSEQVLAPDSNDTVLGAKLRLAFTNLLMPKVVQGNGEDDMLRPTDFSKINEEVKKCGAGAHVNKSGELYRYTVDVRNVQDPTIRFYSGKFTTAAIEALQATSVALPNKVVKPDETWTSTKDFAVIYQDPPPTDEEGKPLPNVKPPPARTYRYTESVTMKYIGSCERDGRREAMVTIEGKISQAPGASYAASGVVRGHAAIEIDTGTVLECFIDKEYDIDTSSKGVKKSASGFFNYVVSRTSPN